MVPPRAPPWLGGVEPAARSLPAGEAGLRLGRCSNSGCNGNQPRQGVGAGHARPTGAGSARGRGMPRPTHPWGSVSRPARGRKFCELVEARRGPDRRAERPPDGEHEPAQGEHRDRRARRRRLEQESGDEGAERRDEERDRAPHALHPAEQPIRSHREPVAVDDRIGGGNRECGREEARDQHVHVGPDEEHAAADPGPELEQQHATHRKQAADERREERPEQDAAAEDGEEQPDLAARQPLLLADDHDGEEDAGADEVRQSVEDCARPQERVMPEEAEPFGEPRANGAGRARVLPGTESASRGATASRRRTRPRR